MATKRKADSYQGVIMNKKLKLRDNYQLPEDTVFFIHTLSNDVQSFMHYDYIMNQFVIRIKKTSGSKTTVITMDEIECHGLLKHIQPALAVAKKYAGKIMPDVIDIPFLTKSMNVGDFGTILFVKENAYKRGEIDFDIRKCAKKDDGEFGYSQAWSGTQNGRY